MRSDDSAPASRDRLVAAVLDAGRELGAAAVFFHANVAATLGLGATDTKTLDLLRQHGPLTPKELSGLVSITPPSLTAVLNRLELKGLVQRRPHPSDGRRLLVEIAPTAYEYMAPLYEGLAAHLQDMLTEYTDNELRVLARGFADAAAHQHAAANELIAGHEAQDA